MCVRVNKKTRVCVCDRVNSGDTAAFCDYTYIVLLGAHELVCQYTCLSMAISHRG